MLVFSNARVIGGFSIFGNTFNAAFLGFPTSSKTPIKGYRVKDSLSTNL